MNIQQLLSNGKPYRTFYRTGNTELLYMELPNGQIARATVYDSGTSDFDFDSDFKFDVNDLVATDWEFV